MKWRMRLLVGAIATAIAGAAMAGWLIARTSAPPTGPVILISVDSLRADRLGAYGSRRALTPSIDALSAESVVFERAYSHSPLTVPAHISILSGRLPIDTGAHDDQGYAVPEKLALLPSLLHRRGFKTAGIVSSPLIGRETGLARAFDFFDDEVPPRSPATPPAEVRRDGAATLAVAERWIEQQGTRFFLFVHLDEARIAPSVGADVAAYEAGVRRADQLVGRLVDSLKARELYDRAVIVLLADHGEALGDHGEVGHGIFLHDATMRTPLVIKMPRQGGGGRRRSEVVQHADVAATILDLMGAPRPSGARGRSLRHLMSSEDPTLAPAPVYAEAMYANLHLGWAELSSVTDGRYRLIRAPRPELYDLLQDPGERDNLADRHPDKVAELGAILDKFTPPADAARPAAVLTDEDREALLALAADSRAAASPTRGATGKPASAADLLEAPGAPAPPNPKDRLPVLEKLRAARDLARERRFQEAIGAYREITALDPGVASAWQASGDLLLAAGRAKEALDAYRHLLQLRPEDARAVASVAAALSRLGRLDEAARVASFAAKLDAAAGNELLVRLNLRRKDYAGARMAADAAKLADPASPLPALVEGLELQRAGKIEEALPHLEEAVQQAAANRVQVADVRVYAAEALARVKRYSDAESRLAEELKWFPDSVRARELLASVYQATGRSAEIPVLVQELIRWSPTPEGYQAASRLSTLAGDKKAAASFLLQGRQLFGGTALQAAER